MNTKKKWIFFYIQIEQVCVSRQTLQMVSFEMSLHTLFFTLNKKNKDEKSTERNLISVFFYYFVKRFEETPPKTLWKCAWYMWFLCKSSLITKRFKMIIKCKAFRCVMTNRNAHERNILWAINCFKSSVIFDFREIKIRVFQDLLISVLAWLVHPVFEPKTLNIHLIINRISVLVTSFINENGFFSTKWGRSTFERLWKKKCKTQKFLMFFFQAKIN